MPDDSRIPDLLEEALSTGRSPESVCADAPELLAEVRRRLALVGRIRSELDALLPEAGSADIIHAAGCVPLEDESDCGS